MRSDKRDKRSSVYRCEKFKDEILTVFGLNISSDEEGKHPLQGLGSTHKNGMVKTFTHTSIPIHPCTLLENEKEKERAKRSTDQT